MQPKFTTRNSAAWTTLRMTSMPTAAAIAIGANTQKTTLSRGT